MSNPHDMAVRVVRAWVRLYTRRLPKELRVTRRAEIDSDLWEHTKDGQEAGAAPHTTALEILFRTCLGVVDDLSWRFEAARQERDASPGARRFVVDFSARQTRWVSILAVASGAIVILLFGLVPTLKVYFASVGIPLPAPTRMVMGLSALVTSYWWASLAGGVAVFLGATRLGRLGAFPNDEVSPSREAVLSKLEPAVIVGLGLIVGGMVLAMFLPIFDVVSAMK